MRRLAGLRGGCIAFALAAAVAGATVVTPASGVDDAATFVGSESCRKCHSSQYERWRTSGHALSVQQASAATLPQEMVRGATVEHPPGRTEFSRSGPAFAANVPLDDGRIAPVTVDLVVGLRRLRMFVTRMADGRHQVLPAMREEPGGAWFDYTHLLFGPTGSAATTPAPVVKAGEPSFWTGPDRSFDARCARCHVSGYEGRPTPKGERGARSTWRALGVDCEACHGPSSRHVAFWNDPPGGGAKDPLVRLASLPLDRAIDVCLQCHLEAEPVDSAFRPGDDLFDHVEPTLLDNTVRIDEAGRPLELVYEGTSFLASTCARAGKLSCIDCHDAHGSANRSALVVPPNRSSGLCAKCHADVLASGAKHARHDTLDPGTSCVSCHMPLVTIERGHGAVHDHTISSPRPTRDGRGACAWCHQGGRGAPADSPEVSRKELAEWFAKQWPGAKVRPVWRDTIAAGRDGRPAAGAALLALVADTKAPRVVRASAAKLIGRTADDVTRELPFLASDRDPLVRRAAIEALAQVEGEDADDALLTALADSSLAVRTAAARTALLGFRRVEDNERLLAAVVPVLEEDARNVPEDHMRWFRLGAARRIAGDDRGAIEAFERKLQLDPGARLVREAVVEMKRRLAK